ncbi:hypothetical protein [Streptomyces flavalbus]|uniref:Uncharacterized protein n=1 Tax=Streptomyces flavalbus TaxID=2665155 RepID=A0ABW2W1K0_9ACTN
MARDDNRDMERSMDRPEEDRSVDKWADRLMSGGGSMDRAQARQFVRNVYEAAQRDLTERDSQAEYEREE